MEQGITAVSDAELAATREAAKAQYAQEYGSGTNEPAAADDSASEDVAETAQKGDAAEPAEKAPEKEKPDPAEEKEEAKAKSEGEIRKEVEREAKRKYLSQINVLKKQLEEKKAVAVETKAKYQNGEADDIEALVEAKIAEREFSEAEKSEKKEVFYSNPSFKEYEAEIAELKADRPDLSWKESALLYAATNKPELLVKAKAKPVIKGEMPKSATADKPKSESDIRKEAEEYYRSKSSFFDR